MAETAGRHSLVSSMRYLFGGVLGLIAAAATGSGAPWYVGLGVLAAAVIVIVGRRRIFRPAVLRVDGEIVCRYVPWFEGNAFLLDVVTPLVGIASLGAAAAPGNPQWLLVTGILLIGLAPAFVLADLRLWRRCFLRFSAPALTVRLPAGDTTMLARERVESIKPETILDGDSGSSLKIEIAYRADDLSGPNQIRTLKLGSQWTVQPKNLLAALLAWSADDSDDPIPLMDRIEHILRDGDAART
jgi:hypothetical protein